MSARDLFNIGRYVAMVLILFGLIIAEFAGARIVGFVVVLLGIAAAGFAGGCGVIVYQQSRVES